VYLERRIMEQLYGKEYADMLALLGFQDLTKTVDDFGPDNIDTQLKLSLTDRDPDEGMNDVAYEKGYLLLRTLEELAGRVHFDRYLTGYFNHYAFQSLSTEQWEAYVRRHLIDSLSIEIDLQTWLYMPGIPEKHSLISSDKFARVDTRAREFIRLGRLDKSNTRSWSTHEWLHFIRQLPTDLHTSFYDKLDNVFQLSDSGNSEILVAWLELSIRSNYLRNHNQQQLEDFLINVGRRKFLTPLYRALRETDELELARAIFARAKDNYHSIAAKSISDLLHAETPAI
ncbi:MAG: aminopeptidase, partial [Saprospiraceae bacterium]|nr:aminopeptidase [Saprospiraceae bacterium]